MSLLNAMLGWEPVYRMMALTGVILIVATIVVEVIRRAKPKSDLGELSARVRSWWVMASVFFVALVVDSRISLVFFALLSFWALKEYVTLLDTRPADHHSLFWAFVAIPAQYVLVGTGWYGMFVLLIPVYMFLFLPLPMVLAGEPKGFVRSASELQWGLMAFVFGLSHLGNLLRFA